MDTRPEDEIFNGEELCKYLKITRNTLYKYTQKRNIPSFKIGKKLRFRKASVDKWIAEQEENRQKRKKGL